MKLLRLGLAIALGVLMPLGVATAQTSAMAQKAKFVPSDPLGAQILGAATAMHGPTVVVGSPLDYHGTNYGSVYVFDITLPQPDTQWHLQPAWGAGGDALFGNAVAVYDERILAGAYHDDCFGVASGAAFFFVKEFGNWVQEAVVYADNCAPMAEFGNAVALYGDFAAIGARFAPDEWAWGRPGAVYVFAHDPTGWTQAAKLYASDFDHNDQFGFAVAIDGQRIAVGSLYAKNNGVPSGAVYILDLMGSTWVQTGRIHDPTLPANAGFGHSLSLEGDRIAIGAIDDATTSIEPGVAYVYRKDGPRWVKEFSAVSPGPAPSDLFAESVVLEDRWLAVGAPQQDEISADSGVVYLYERVPLRPPQAGDPSRRPLPSPPDGTTSHSFASWIYRGHVESTDLGVEHHFGTFVAMSKGFLAVGAPGGESNGLRCGAAYVFESWNSVPFGGPYCFGDGSGTQCPCGNNAPPNSGTGCMNSLERGAALGAIGSRSLAIDDMIAVGYDMVPNELALLSYARHSVNGGHGYPFNDGLMCLGTPNYETIIRFTDIYGHATWGPDFGNTFGWVPGDTWQFQVWYRDPFAGPCGTQLNSTNAFEINFTF